MRTPLVLTSLLMAGACGAPPVSVSLGEAAEGLARFVVENGSEQDVRSISFEVSYRSEAGDVVQVDTVNYASTTDAAGNKAAFVEAGDETFFMSEMPSISVSASATVVELTFSDGTGWPERR